MTLVQMQHLHALATAEIIRIRLQIERYHCNIIIMLQLLRMYQENIGSTQWFLFWRWWHHFYNLFLCQHTDYMKSSSFHVAMAITVSYPCWYDCQCQGHGQRKLFITGQAKLNLSTIELISWVANELITTDILFLSVVLKCYKPNKSKNHIATVLIT